MKKNTDAGTAGEQQTADAPAVTASFDEIHAAAIAAKVAAGLTREQAIQVITSQVEEDAKAAPVA